MRTYLNSLIDSLSLDHKRGAAEIVADAETLFVEIANLGLEEAANAEQLFTRAVRRLANGQPSMAPVLNLLNRVCLAREQASDNKQLFREKVGDLVDSMMDISKTMISRANELPRVERTLMTFSNSSTVANQIIACREYGCPRMVYCGEGRPVMEGLVMARRLMSSGVEVTLFTNPFS